MVCHHLIEEGQCNEHEKIEPIWQFIADTNGDKQKRDNRNLIALMLSRDDEYCVIKWLFRFWRVGGRAVLFVV